MAEGCALALCANVIDVIGIMKPQLLTRVRLFMKS